MLDSDEWSWFKRRVTELKKVFFCVKATGKLEERIEFNKTSRMLLSTTLT